MKKKYFLFTFCTFSLVSSAQNNFQQNKQSIYNEIINEVQNNNQLEHLAFELLDEIGPRLVGSPEMQQAHNWVTNTYKKWNIKAENIAYGEWKSWQRGTTQIEMTYPRIKSIEGMQLAWNANILSVRQSALLARQVYCC